MIVYKKALTSKEIADMDTAYAIGGGCCCVK